MIYTASRPEPAALMQDEESGRDGRRYCEWLATRPESRRLAREAAHRIAAYTGRFPELQPEPEERPWPESESNPLTCRCASS